MAQFYCQLRKMGVPVEYVDVGGGSGRGLRRIALHQRQLGELLGAGIRQRRDLHRRRRGQQARIFRIPTSSPNRVGRSRPTTASWFSTSWRRPVRPTGTKSCTPSAADDIDLVKDLQTILQEGSGTFERARAVARRPPDPRRRPRPFLHGPDRPAPPAPRPSACSGASRSEGHPPRGSQMKHPAVRTGRSRASFWPTSTSATSRLFQSLPDSWAIDQIFPIMPIQRLDEEPTPTA